VRRTWAWIAGGFGVAALVRALLRRGEPGEETSIAYAPDTSTAVAEAEAESSPERTGEAEPEVDPRAEELRARLEEAKAAGSDRDEFEAGETTVDASVSAIDLEARRRAVHDEARSAIDEMRGGPGDSAA
jgi:hypothetical protein